MAVNSLQGATDPISKGIVDAKGDLIVGTADNTIDSVSVGNNGEIVVADSNETAGIKWSSAEEVAGLESGDSFVGGSGIDRVVALTQAQYDALTPDATTLYVITD